MKRKKIVVWLACLLLAVLLAAATHSYFRWGPHGSPLRAAHDVLSALEYHDCETAWRYFSSESQRKIERESAEIMRSASWSHVRKDLLEPKKLACMPTAMNPFVAYKPNSVKLVKVGRTTAVVSVKKAHPEGFLIPGFWPTRTRYEDKEITLLQESGEWKVLVPLK